MTPALSVTSSGRLAGRGGLLLIVLAVAWIAPGKSVVGAPYIAIFLTLGLLAGTLPLAAQDTATLAGEPAIRFMAGHGHLTTYCDGQLWITATRVRFDGVDEVLRTLALGPQTSGGLLVGVPAAHAKAWDDARAAQHVDAWRVGDVVEGRGVTITT